jgi:hypothetical protein
VVRVVRARKAMRVRCVSPSTVVPLRSATSLVLQRQTVARGGVLFLKLRNILCSPAPSRALEIFDAASTISLPAPPPSSTPRRAHLYLLVESRRPIARLDRARHTRICATACCRSCTQRECAACERGADSVRIDARAPCASVRAPVGKAPHWTHSLSPCQTPRHLSARRRARSRRSSC